MRILAPTTLILLSCLAAITPARRAQACGGCFHGADSSTPSVVVGHRMALSISPTRTVLWDQVQYAGDPKDFAWVLPVGPGATIEASSDAWFEALEAVTATHVMSSTLTCNGRDLQQAEGGGCAGSPKGAALDSAPTDEGHSPTRQGSDPGVSVEHEGTVGPYETVTLKADDATSLKTWLTTHGYSIPSDIDPVIDGYIAAGSEFIALRLAPGAGVRQMTPVRVVTPGASPVLPLRMVAAGTGANVAIVLYVISEGRYGTQNFPAATIDGDALTWDWSASKSNYAEVRDQALAQDGFLTSFAAPKAFTTEIQTPSGPASYQVVGTTLGRYDNLTDLYFAQAAADELEPDECAGRSKALYYTASVIQESCSASGCIEAKSLECGGFSDVAAALIGLHPIDTWVTRLEANLSRAALGDDLVLQAAEAQVAVESWITVSRSLNAPCAADDPTADPDGSSSDGSGSCICNMRPVVPNAIAGLAFAASLLLAARRASRRRR